MKRGDKKGGGPPEAEARGVPSCPTDWSVRGQAPGPVSLAAARDKECYVLLQVVRLVMELDPPGQQRVLAYLRSRFGIQEC